MTDRWDRLSVLLNRIEAKIIKRGGLVLFPTETVYGLGANGLEEKAIKKIYEAKGRKPDNPLILHISKFEMLSQIAKEIKVKITKLLQKNLYI